MAAGVHPDGTADRARDADRPLQAGEARPPPSGGRGPAGRHRRRRRPRGPRRRRSRRRGRRPSTAMPAKPMVGDEQVGAAADDVGPAAPTPGVAAATVRRSSSERARRTAPPGHRRGRSSAGPAAHRGSPAGRAPRDGSPFRAAPTCRRAGLKADRLRGAPGEDLLGQAWRCHHTPSRCTRRRDRPRRRGTTRRRRGAAATRRARWWASMTAFTTSLPVTPGIGVVPDG